MEKDQEILRCSAIVIKVASRCNLNCTYCYMYNMGDETYRKQPKFMRDEVVDALLLRIRNHCQEHNLESFIIVFHGGEPLLAGHEFYRKFVAKANSMLSEHVRVRYSVQTNGVLLDDEWCKLFGELNVYVGVSLDGTPAQNDKFRIDHSGRGSYNNIVKGLQVALNSTDLRERPGVLCVVDAASDPVETYNHFKTIGARDIDFLLPDANYEKPSPGKEDIGSVSAPYGDWFIKIFEYWYNDPKDRVSIRFFRHIIHGLLGKDFVSEQIGGGNNEVLIVETNGSIETSDILKICGDGFTKDNSHVFTTELSEALETDLVKMYNLSHKQLCAKCQRCPIVEICGGGFLPHRYSKENAFNNPSIYCYDLLKIITHIQNRIIESLPAEVLEESGISAIAFEEAVAILNNDYSEVE
ncbi:radical SAM protein [Ohtaekwangia kribbensis]|uniref:Radical SAM protein n=1 Tax=Ohtaekwangia kribbensis TaxID=688913 RepID=A0ABW3K8M4_9BACT